MIALSLSEIAEIVGGVVAGGSPDLQVSAPAVLDGRTAQPGGLFVAMVGEHVDGHEYADQAAAAGAVAVLGSRSTVLPTVVVADVQLALQTLAAEVLRRLRSAGEITVIGLTGSAGKTSAKDMLATILASQAPTVATIGSLNNELGVPLTVLRADEATRFLVLEMGARGIGHIAELTALAPLDVAVVLNVGTAHVGEFGSQDVIAQAKSELVADLGLGDVAVLNADDPRVAGMSDRVADEARVLTFGASDSAEVRLGEVTLDRLGRPHFQLSIGGATAHVDLPIVGVHQAHNASAAVAAALAVGVDLADAAKALEGAMLSRWRMELSELPSGLTVLNDSYNANPESMRAAVDALATLTPGEGGRRVAVLGEMRELGDSSAGAHFAIGAYAAEHAVDLVVVIGMAAAQIEMGARTTETHFAGDNAEAIAWLQANLTPADVVLVKASRGARLDEVAEALR